MATIDVPSFGPEDDAIAAYLAIEAVAIAQASVIELARQCLIQQRNDYAGRGGH